jgi:hypothetical protein
VGTDSPESVSVAHSISSPALGRPERRFLFHARIDQSAFIIFDYIEVPLNSVVDVVPMMLM